jgi:hypothetical protein
MKRGQRYLYIEYNNVAVLEILQYTGNNRYDINICQVIKGYTKVGEQLNWTITEGEWVYLPGQDNLKL